MKQRTRIETAFEIARVFVYGDNGWRDSAAWCRKCGGYVPMVTLFWAATLGNTTVATIFRLIETGELHPRTTKDGETFACLSSLLDAPQGLTTEETASEDYREAGRKR